MKKNSWRIGLAVSIVLFFLQWGTVAYAKEQNAVSKGIGSAVELCVNYYKYDEAEGRYYEDKLKRKIIYCNRGDYYHFYAEPDAGYEVKEIRVNKSYYTVAKDIIFIMNRTTRVDVYEKPIAVYEQITYYYKYNAIHDRNELYDVQVDKVKKGEVYTTNIRQGAEFNMHVESVWFGDEKRMNTSNFSYKVTGHSLIKVHWYPNRTYIVFHPEGGEGRMQEQIVYYNQSVRLNQNSFTRSGYEFVGWKGTIGGEEKQFANRDVITSTFRTDGARIHLYAIWKPSLEWLTIKYYQKDTGKLLLETKRYGPEDVILFHQEKGTVMHRITEEESRSYAYSQETTMKSLGWTLQSGDEMVMFDAGGEIRALDFYESVMEKLGKNISSQPEISLYEVVDKGPKIILSRGYFSQKDAREGKIDKEYLESLVRVWDEEDGKLTFGKEVELLGYSEEKFIESKANDTLTFTVKAIDHVGNETQEKLICKIVGANPKRVTKKRRVRFISAEYVESIASNSIWRMNHDYHATLNETLGIQ